ncbi:MAG: hypothetical protein MK234_05975 [Nitrospinales bacterium]|nr:hypothetical protein [Nitrospinales bacterium]
MIIEEDFSRRKFIRYSMIGGTVVPLLSGIPAANEVYGGVFHTPKDLDNLTETERIHLPNVNMPPVVEDGTQDSIILSMDHPMEEDHYIKSIQILNFADPVVIKGKFYLTPANGETFFSTQIRLAGGEGTVWVVAECNKHGKWAANRTVNVAAGGC